ncbi:reactive intermediate/imine deaminase [Erysipelothrix sp. HDW6B]|uniref:RidA family protein n=1 Tax=Erysipelothrix TaxID=1647 RepID=UPI00135C8032|nr:MULTISPECIES: Rid family detoxifying hydrolase [Erysipelothrix]QIK86468.1 reactive intermediate/imine deaminase [Erysipelothrix sp. HDW6B]
MKRRQIIVKNGPKAVGPYSAAIQVDHTVYVSGQLGIDLEANLVGDDIVTQTRKAIENLENTLRSAGLELKDIVKTTVYLSDMDNFELMNQTYAIYFAHPYPARTAFEVARLPKNALVEIEAIAVASELPDFEDEKKTQKCKGKYCID